MPFGGGSQHHHHHHVDPTAQLSAQVGMLEKQLEFYRGLVQQHHQVLAEVYSILPADGRSELSALQRRVHSLHKDQEDAIEGRNAAFSASPRSGTVLGDTAAAALQTEAVEAIADEASHRIQTATVKLLNLWHEHTANKFEHLLQDGEKALEGFQDTPTEDSLAAFFNSFHDTCAAVRQHFLAHEGREVLGPKGNPFEMDDRLQKLMRVTIQEAIESHVPSSDPQVRHDPRWAEQDRRQQQGGATKNPPPLHADASSRHPPIPSRREREPAEDPQVSPSKVEGARLGLGHHHRSGGEVPQGMKLGGGGGGELAGGRSDAPSSIGSRPSSRANTPSGRARNDSSQMRQMLGGASGGGGDGGGEEMSMAFENLPRLAQLKATLQQLEFQLGACAQTGRDSGSEAKYYALSKKLQRVRAEVLKEQREQEALEKIRSEQMTQRALKQEHRRVFKR